MGYLNTPQKKISSSPANAKTSEPQVPHQSGSMSKVRVIVRVRPFLSQEISQDRHPISCVSVLDSELESCDEVSIHLKDQETSRNECYKLDAFFGEEDNSVSKIFDREVRPLIPSIFQGCNATVFAYGATGSGKTYTMQGSDELPGLMPLAMATILSMCHGTESIIKISYYEVYMDRCYDLLELKEKEIAVWDDKDGQIHFRGLAQRQVSSVSEFHEAFSCAIQRRKVAHTGLNDVSSRSHGVLVISVSTHCHDHAKEVISGKLNLIDLAGNEDNRKTCNEGIRLQESAKINQSLFALSNVIYALNNNKPRVPYRESKLTRILQDSLGGRSRALMVACLNPGEYQESVHTVKLAARSRQVSNLVSSAQKKDIPKVKFDMEAKLRAWLESKGKAKSAQRNVEFASPLMSNTPNYVRSLKKTSAGWSSSKPKIIGNSCSSAFEKRAPYAARRNLFNQDQDRAAKGAMKEECKVTSDDIVKSNNCMPGTLLPLDEPTIKEEKMAGRECSLGLSPASEKLKELQTPLRKVLSPVNSNVNTENTPAKDQMHFLLSDQQTPRIPSAVDSAENEFEEIRTPLDKFQTRSSNLKNSLVQEYVEFLNTASREELLELKGIGQKMAEYIMELRETSPLQSLSDLEKLGLSSKQVHNMFSRAARGVLA